MNNALIIVDLQKDFIAGGALAVEDGEQVVPIANKLMGKFACVVGLKDYHPPDHCSFVESHDNKEPGDRIQVEGLEQILWPMHCVQGSKGADFAPGLMASGIDKVITKGIDRNLDSYSGFFDNGKRRQTDLDDYLKKRNVKDVFVMGLATNVCVEATVLDALALGYDVCVIEDGIRGIDLEEGDIQRSIQRMKEKGANFAKSKELPLSLSA